MARSPRRIVSRAGHRLLLLAVVAGLAVPLGTSFADHAVPPIGPATSSPSPVGVGLGGHVEAASSVGAAALGSATRGTIGPSDPAGVPTGRSGGPVDLPPVPGALPSVGPSAASVRSPSPPAAPASPTQTSWVNLTPNLTVRPSGRQDFSMAYDPPLQEVVLFGGVGSSGASLGDTWTFGNGAWTNLTSTLATSPGARLDAGIAYDPALGGIVLYGGRGGPGPTAQYNDTWLFNRSGWTNLHPSTNPGLIDSIPLAYDPVDGYLFLSSHPWATIRPQVDWTFANLTWTNVTTKVHGAPPAVNLFPATDPTDGAIVYYGGVPSGSCVGLSLTWEYERGSFFNLTRNQTVALYDSTGSTSTAFDERAEGVVQFAGYGSGCAATNGTYLFRHGLWTNLSAAQNAPPARWAGGLVFDEALGGDLLFGGNGARFGGSVSLLNDVWLFLSPEGPVRDDGNWTVWNRTPQLAAPAVAYDAHDGYAVLFGGDGPGPGSSGAESNGTWRFVNGSWTILTPPVAPSPRRSAMMVYDAADGYLLLFGGEWYNSTTSTWTYYNDTWELAAGKWTELHPAKAPPARGAGGLVYDAADAEVVLYGGSGNAGALRDTWSFSAGAWTNRTGSVAPPDFGGALAYDAADGYVVLFGGTDPTTGAILNQTWTFLGSTWTQRAPSPSPPGRTASAMTYDGADGYVLLVGGFNRTSTFSGYLRDAWEYLSGVWTNATPTSLPSGADGAASLIYDAAAQKLLLYDGSGLTSGSSATLSNAWLYSVGTWAPVPRIAYPAPECCGAGVFDSRDGYPIFFGGVEPTGASAFVALNTTWSFRNSSWTVLPTPAAPPARYYYGLVDDPADGYVLLYGGEWGDCSTGSCGLYSDTWRFSGGNWTKLSPAQSPGQRLGFAMDYDAALGGVLLYGGLSSSGSVLNDTWEFSGGSWTQLHGATSPPPLEFARMAYDAADNATILFGGKNTAGNFGETWSFADSTWTQLSVGWAPSWRWGETLVYDGETNFLLLYGGITNGSSDADAWGYSDGFWTDLPRTPSPVAGAMQEALYDPQLGQVLMFGGLGTTYTSDLWFWTYAGRFVIQEEALGRDATDIGQTVVGTAWVEGGRANVSLSWSGLPPGCGRTDLLTVYCRPTATGTYAIAVQAADAVGSVATAGPVNLTVVADPIASTPVANRSSLDVGQSVSFRETATLGSGGYTYDWLVLPTGCSGITALVRCSPTGAGVFNVTVEVTDANGFSSVAPTLAVTVYDDPSLVSFSANRTSADAGQSTNFTTNVTAGSGGYLYLWSGLPTGCNGLGPSAICSDQLPGVYVVSVTITDSNGFTIRTNVLPFTIYPDPVVGVPVASQPSADINQSVTFTGNPQFGSGGYVYAWIGLPTGCLGTTQRVMCTIEAAGSFLVAVRVVDSNGYSVTSASVAFVALGDPVVAGPVASPPSVDVGESVTFSATPSGGSGGYTLAWNDLPPPCSPTAVSPSCVAGAPGTYAVSVTVNDTNGYRVVGGPIAFHVSELPTVAAPLPSTRSVDAGQNVSFRVSFTPGSGGDRFQWLDLPSGCNATGPLANCTDPGAGSYHVGARVTDSNGGTSVSPLTGFTVYSDPVATDLRANRSSADVSQPVTLTASATSGSGNFTYAWAGLPTTCGGSASQLRCAFAEPGVYGITVQATDSNGVSTSVIGLNFTVDPLPALSGPTPSATVVDVGQSIHFTTTLTGGSGNESYNWTGLPPGCTPPDAAEWTCTPTRAGTWTIGLTARDSNGAQSTGASFTLVVHPAVEISAIGATPSSILAGATVLFSAAVDGGTSPYTYSWTGLPAGCTARNAAEISCQPTASGTFRVGLTVRDAAGGTVYTNVTVTVAPSLFGLPVDEAYALILGGALAVAALGAAAFWRRRRGRAAADAAEEETPPPEEPPAGPEEPPEAEGPVEEGGAGGTASDEEPAPGDVGGLESPGSDGA